MNDCEKCGQCARHLGNVLGLVRLANAEIERLWLLNQVYRAVIVVLLFAVLATALVLIFRECDR